MEIDWKKIRSKYPVLDKCTYLNTASSGAISKGTAAVMKSFADDQLYNATLNRSNWIASIEEARANTAKLINADISEVAFTPDVSIAMSIIAQSLHHKKNVVLLRDEFPSVALPWISHGYEIAWIERADDQTFDLADFDSAMKAGAQVVVVSWVHYNSGIATDLETLGQLCKKYNTLLVVDGTQGLGAIPLDVKKFNIDILMGSTFKWLTGGYGICIVYVADRVKRMLNPNAKGWNSLIEFGVIPTNKANWKLGAASLELGHLKYINIIGFGHALKELQEIGIESINERVGVLRTYLLDQLADFGLYPIAPDGKQSRSGIMTAKVDKTLFQLISEQQIISTYREGYIRLSVHFYNDFEDVDRLVNTISGYSRAN